MARPVLARAPDTGSPEHCNCPVRLWSTPIGRGGMCFDAVGRWRSIDRGEAFRSGASAESGAGFPRPDSVRAAQRRCAGALFGCAGVSPRPQAQTLSLPERSEGDRAHHRQTPRVHRGGGVPGLRSISVLASLPGLPSRGSVSRRRDDLGQGGPVRGTAASSISSRQHSRKRALGSAARARLPTRLMAGLSDAVTAGLCPGVDDDRKKRPRGRDLRPSSHSSAPGRDSPWAIPARESSNPTSEEVGVTLYPCLGRLEPSLQRTSTSSPSLPG